MDNQLFAVWVFHKTGVFSRSWKINSYTYDKSKPTLPKNLFGKIQSFVVLPLGVCP